MKKILILNAAPRKEGNTAALIKAFTKGATESGNELNDTPAKAGGFILQLKVALRLKPGFPRLKVIPCLEHSFQTESLLQEPLK